MPKKRQLVTSNNCFELGKVGLLKYSNEKHALDLRERKIEQLPCERFLQCFGFSHAILSLVLH